jgi:S1-C subfamily serine protease
MRREEPAADPSPRTLEEALHVPDLGDGEVVRDLWPGLAAEPAIVESPVEAVPPPVQPVDLTALPDPRRDADVLGAELWLPAAAPPHGSDPRAVEVAEPEDRRSTRREARRRHRAAKEQARLAKLAKRRHRILPRTVLGLASMLLCFGLGVGLAGGILYAYYDWRLSENEQRVGELSASLEQRLQEANEELDLTGQNQIEALRREASGLRELVADQAVVADLTGELAGQVWFVETLDENGAASVGSAFVAASSDTESLLVTSYAVVAAGVTEPSPTISVRSGDERLEAELYNWDPEHDLALLVVPRGGLEAMPWAGDRALSRIVGKHVWAVEGIGGNGVSLSPGIAIDQSVSGIQHTASLNQAFRGGPIVNGRGQVVAVASLAYTPLGFPSGDVSFGVPVQTACDRVLSCSGEVPGAA